MASSISNKSRIGRPTAEESKRRHGELLDRALDVFLDLGYEQTTMLHIANTVGMSKRTIYSHYRDKEALFEAAVKRAIVDYTIPREALEEVRQDSLKETLKGVARLRITNISTPVGLKLQRILNAQDQRFPSLVTAAFETAVEPTSQFLVELFEQHQSRGDIRRIDAERAAWAFLTLAGRQPALALASGKKLDQQEIEVQIDFSVDLFLYGICHR